MMKLLAFILVLSTFTTCSGLQKKGELVCFKSLYLFDVMRKMETKLASAQCIDLRKHFLSSKPFAEAGESESGNIITSCMPAKKAVSFCKNNSGVEICDSLDYLMKKNEKKIHFVDSFDYDYKKYILSTVSNPVFSDSKKYDQFLKLFESKTSSGNCLLDTEFKTAKKYTEAFQAVSTEDNGLAYRAIELFENSFEPNEDMPWDEDELVDLQDYCMELGTNTVSFLLENHKEMLKKNCLPELALKGISINDKKKVYCGGETPLACTLSKTAAALKKEAF